MSEWNYRFFEESEFACPCCEKAEMNRDFMRKMVNLRLAFKNPIIINSGYRCSEYNAQIGGKDNSAHLEGRAADVKVHGDKARRLVGAAEFCGFGGIGVSQRGGWSSRFIHLDNAEKTTERPRPWLWSY